jgi:hypothetical protein
VCVPEQAKHLHVHDWLKVFTIPRKYSGIFPRKSFAVQRNPFLSIVIFIYRKVKSQQNHENDVSGKLKILIQISGQMEQKHFVRFETFRRQTFFDGKANTWSPGV